MFGKPEHGREYPLPGRAAEFALGITKMEEDED